MAAPGAINIVPRGRARILRIQGTSSYGTGGYTLPGWLQEIINAGGPIPPAGLNEGTVIAKISGGLVQFITAASGAEVASLSDQSGNVVSILLP